MLVLFLFQLVGELVENNDRIIVLLELEIEIGKVRLNPHSQEASILFFTPSDDVLAQLDQLRVPALDLHRQVEESTGDLGPLGLGEVDEKWQHSLCQVDELLHESFLSEDRCQFVSGLLLGSNGVIIEVIWRGHFLLNHFFKQFDGGACLLTLNSSVSRLYFFG